MSAKKNLQPQQLKMFMSANEIMSSYGPNPGDRYASSRLRSHDMTKSSGGTRWSYEREETDDELWERKRDEAWDSGVAQSIIDEGVKEPVNLNMAWGTVGNGHHRVAVMHEEAPHELIPVLHHKHFSDAIKGGYEPAIRRAMERRHVQEAYKRRGLKWDGKYV